VRRYVRLARRAECHAPPAGPSGLAVEQRGLPADQEALRGGDEPLAVPLQQHGDGAAGAAGDYGDAANPGVEGGGEAVSALFGVLFGQHQPVPHDVAGERADDLPVAAEPAAGNRISGGCAGLGAQQGPAGPLGQDQEVKGPLPVAGLGERGELGRVETAELHLGGTHELAYHPDDHLITA